MTRTYQGTVVKGEIRLDSNIQLPENSRVYVVVPEASDAARASIRTPRLAHPEQAREFQMEVHDEVRDADV
jgi:hypothetical protein